MFVPTLETYSSPEGPRVKSNSPIKAAPKDAYLEAYKRATARRTDSGADQVKPRDSVDTTEAEGVDNSADKGADQEGLEEPSSEEPVTPIAKGKGKKHDRKGVEKTT